MRERLQTLRRAHGDEGGFTIVELLVGATISLIVLGAAMATLQFAVHASPTSNDRADQIQQGRVLIERMSRELRQGESIDLATSSSFEVLTYVNSQTCGGSPASTTIACRVTYTCDSQGCTRTEHDGAGGGSAEIALEGIIGPDVFTYCEADGSGCGLPAATDPDYVGINLVFPRADGAEAVTLSDGVTLRNFNPSPAA